MHFSGGRQFKLSHGLHIFHIKFLGTSSASAFDDIPAKPLGRLRNSLLVHSADELKHRQCSKKQTFLAIMQDGCLLGQNTHGGLQEAIYFAGHRFLSQFHIG